MSDLTVSLTLTADGRGLQGAVRATEEELDRLVDTERDLQRESGRADKATDELTGGLDKQRRTTKRTKDETRELSRTYKILHADVFTLRNAFGALGIGLMTRQFIQAATQMEQYQVQLRAVTGSVEAAGVTMQWLAQESDRLGIRLQDMVGNFAQMSAAARGTALEGQGTREVFLGVAEAARVMGLGGQQVDLVFRAITQIMAKGKVSAEEMRQQLGEQLPMAIQVMARALNVTTAELDDMMSQGELTLEALLPFARQLRSEMADGLPGAVNSAQAAFARFDTAMFSLKATIGEELLPQFVRMVKWISETAIPATSFWLERLAGVQREIGMLSAGEQILKLEELDAKLAINQRRIDASAGLAGAVGMSAALGPGGAPQLNAQFDVAALRRERDDLARQRAEVVREVNRFQARARATTLGEDVPEWVDPAAVSSGGGATPGGGGGGASSSQQRLLDSVLPEQAAWREYQQTLEAINAAKLDSEQRTLAVARAEAQYLAAATQGGQVAEEYEAKLQALDEKRVAAIEGGLEKLRTSLATEVELEEQRLAEGSALLRAALDEKLVTIAEHQQLQQDLEADHQRRLVDIEKRALKEREGANQEMLKALETTIEGFSRDFADAMLDGTRGFDDFVENILRQLARIAISEFTKPLFSGFASFASGLFGSAHGGGVAGNFRGHASAPAAAFVGAPRFHGGGIAGDEVPAILQRGEGVFTPEQMKAMGQANVVVNIQAPAGSDTQVSEPRAEGNTTMVDVLVMDSLARLQASGQSDPLFRSYGGRRQPVVR